MGNDKISSIFDYLRHLHRFIRSVSYNYKQQQQFNSIYIHLALVFIKRRYLKIIRQVAHHTMAIILLLHIHLNIYIYMYIHRK